MWALSCLAFPLINTERLSLNLIEGHLTMLPNSKSRSQAASGEHQYGRTETNSGWFINTTVISVQIYILKAGVSHLIHSILRKVYSLIQEGSSVNSKTSSFKRERRSAEIPLSARRAKHHHSIFSRLPQDIYTSLTGSAISTKIQGGNFFARCRESIDQGILTTRIAYKYK